MVIFDGRGVGQSDAPDMPYTMEMFADDLAGLLDVIGINSAHVYGESFGGGVAQYFAIRHLEKVKSLILVSTTCRGTDSSKEINKYTSGTGEITDEQARTVVRLTVSQDFIDKNPGIVEKMVENFKKRPPPSRSSILQQQAFLVANTCRRLPDIKVPTLVIHGEADGVIPVENGRFLASRIPNAELMIFKNTGHFFVEAPVERDKAALDFLRRHRLTHKEE